MDIQDTKEQRQAFEAWCIQWNIASVFPLDDEGQYSDYNIHLLYCAWLQGQAAKAQAVPDGFVLVEVEKLNEIRDQVMTAKYASFNNDSDRIFSDIEDIQINMERLIEAQESAND